MLLFLRVVDGWRGERERAQLEQLAIVGPLLGCVVDRVARIWKLDHHAECDWPFGDSFLQSEMNFSGAMLILAVTLVGSVLQLPGVGGGAQIASFIGMTKIFGIEQEPAAAIAVMLWIITFASCTLLGIPLLIHEGMSFGELRKLARAEAEAEAVGKHIGNGGNGATGVLIPRGGFKEKESGDFPK